jgi:hypothetical protein
MLHRIVEKLRIYLNFTWATLLNFLIQKIAEYFICSTEWVKEYNHVEQVSHTIAQGFSMWGWWDAE